MQRDVFTADHEAFRLVVREFVEREVVPLYAEWERAGQLPRKFFRQLGALGVMGMAVPEEYGGAGDSDYRYNVVLQEEAARAQVTLGTLRTQLEVILPYFLGYSSEEQRRRWLPGLAAGELLTAIAMTEPDTGSDLAGMRTTAVRDGGDYVLNGAKTFITGGLLADLVIVVARTSTEEGDRRDRRRPRRRRRHDQRDRRGLTPGAAPPRETVPLMTLTMTGALRLRLTPSPRAAADADRPPPRTGIAAS